MQKRVDLGYRAREQFRPFHKRSQRWASIVAHRRAGKTVACVMDLLDAALRCTKPKPRFAYIAPLLNQAKDIAWGYVKQFASPIPGVEFNEAELRAVLPNGATLRLYGADNPDRLRGIYLDGLVLDEYGDMSPKLWAEVARPALADRQGWATFIGTPKGKNQFWEIHDAATRDPQWLSLCLKASETGLLAQSELDDARKLMGEDRYEQEFECSFDAAIVGSYYGREMREATEAGRVTKVPHDAAHQVETWWDLGYSDATAIWFVQRIGYELRVIDYYDNDNEALPHYAETLKSKGYTYSRHVLPHDAKNHWVGSQHTPRQILEQLGVRPIEIAPDESIENGVNSTRLMLSKCVWDAEKCKRGLEALRQYRREWDDERKTYKTKPLHDWTSHAADAFRMGAVTPAPVKEWGKALNYSNKGIV